MKFPLLAVAAVLLTVANAFQNVVVVTSVSSRRTTGSTRTALSMTATLYGHPGTRSPLINWGASEVGVDLVMGDLTKNPHPFGQIPCLTDENGVLVFESGAILMYLHDQTKDKLSPKDAAAVTSWIVWANASLDPICFLETPDGKVYDTGLKKPNKRLDQLDQMLSKQPFLVGSDFTLADVAVASYLLYVLQFFPGVDVSSRWPNMKRYMKDCASREFYGKAFGAKVQGFLLEQLVGGGSLENNKKLFGMF